MKQVFILLLAITSFILLIVLSYGCGNVGRNTERLVDNEISKSKIEMANEIENNKIQFNGLCEKALNDTKDIASKEKLERLQESVIQTAIFLDSLKKEMDKLDEFDGRSVDIVKNVFLYHNAGDSIFSKLKSTIGGAEETALNNDNKVSIINMRDSLLDEPDSRKWNEQLFGLTNSLGASMILYGIQIQLYRIGMEALKGY